MFYLQAFVFKKREVQFRRLFMYFKLEINRLDFPQAKSSTIKFYERAGVAKFTHDWNEDERKWSL